MDQLTIPCEDCASTKARLQDRGFRVDSCDPAPGRPDFCLISFDHPEALARSAIAAVAAAPSASVGLTPTQARTAQAIVNIFETGEVLGVYGQVTVIAGDTGHLTYGRSQTTLGSGNLHTLIRRYCANVGARFGPRLEPYLPRLQAKDLSLDDDKLFSNLLRASADDPVMREVQDAFFDDTYWKPALNDADELGVRTALGVAVVYDSHVHGSWPTIRDKVIARTGSIGQVGERSWISSYVDLRRAWLASSERADLRATVYRMDAFRRLIDQGMWGLALPIVVRGKELSTAALSASPPGCYDGPQPGTRALAVQSPLNRGLDVRLVQLGLSERGMNIQADGVYGQASFNSVRTFQIAHGMPATGTADIALIALLTG